MVACALAGAALAGAAPPGAARGQAPRALPEGRLPDDARLRPLKDLDGYFPLVPPRSVEEWTKRAEFVRRRLKVALDLWPAPAPTPLNAVVHGRVAQKDYSVEKVYFESVPGFYVTGNLYRPVGKSGKHPGVLCPHGHWSNGRFHDAGLAATRNQIIEGAERFEEGGRSPLQARCAQLARMGCVVFHYDMLGYADSQQLSFELTHRFAKQRPEMNTLENWGLFSPQAEAHLQSVMGLQTLNSARALDFLLGLEDVDATRVAVTGASGGGTQTMLLCAIDERPTLSFPAVMVSTAMQGGCTCENCGLLRVDTGNIEFAALFAPKPQGLTAADDWTREMATKGFPEIKQVYEVLGAPKHVMLKNSTHFGHNYNYVARSAMYQWVNQHFKLGLPTPVIEEDYPRLDREQLTVWNAEHPRPAGGDAFERKLLRYLHDDAQKQLAALTPQTAEGARPFREVVGGAWDVLIGRGLPPSAEVEYLQTSKVDQGDYLRILGLLKHKPRGEELPIAFYYPKQWEGQVVLWLADAGHAGLLKADGAPRAEVADLLAKNVCVVGVDLFMQGEFLPDGQPPTQTRKVGNPRESAGYTFGYNHSLFAQRTHDVLTTITFLRNHEIKPKRVLVLALGGVGPIAAAARAQAQDAVDKLAAGTGGFRFAKRTDFHDVNFLPGGAKYLDVPGACALSAPWPLWLADETEQTAPIARALYQATGRPEALTFFAGKSDEQTSAALAWLLE